MRIYNVFKILFLFFVFAIILAIIFPQSFSERLNIQFRNENPKNTYNGRNYDITNHEYIDKIELGSKLGVFITYGQSNSANFGEMGYKVKSAVFNFFNGAIFSYKDPVIGSDGFGGSVWGMVGDKLIENEIYDNVVFSNSGWGDTKLSELNNGNYLGYFLLNYRAAMSKFGKVDAILFHQGESDYNSQDTDYYNEFNKLLIQLKKYNINAPIFLSRASICGENNKSNLELINIQNKIINDFELVYEGPNTDLLSEKKYRLQDNCHFSLIGLEKFSQMWIDCLVDIK